ncbi:MAG: divalent-cation tolerance protein CutA [Candidatus Omnitrophota bacterium]
MYIVVLVAARGEEEAERIAKALLEQRLAACVNIVCGAKSLFWWQGKIDKASEALLLIKTKRGCFDKLQDAVRKVHSYDLPEIIALPIVAGEKGYLEWVDGLCVSGLYSEAREETTNNTNSADIK